MRACVRACVCVCVWREGNRCFFSSRIVIFLTSRREIVISRPGVSIIRHSMAVAMFLLRAVDLLRVGESLYYDRGVMTS